MLTWGTDCDVGLEPRGAEDSPFSRGRAVTILFVMSEIVSLLCFIKSMFTGFLLTRVSRRRK